MGNIILSQNQALSPVLGTDCTGATGSPEWMWQPLSGCHDWFFLWLCSRFQEGRRETNSHIVRKCNSLRTLVATDASRCLDQSLLQYLKMYSLATCKLVSTMWICIYCHETVYIYCLIACILVCIVYIILGVAVNTTNFVTNKSILLFIGTGIAKCFNPSYYQVTVKNTSLVIGLFHRCGSISVMHLIVNLRYNSPCKNFKF
jgi:hypothetical protein